MLYESKFKKFIRALGLILGVVMVGMGSMLTFLPVPETAATVGTFFVSPGAQEVRYEDTPILVPDFIPYTKIASYLKYDLYTTQHIRFSSYYCPNGETISHREGYCHICDPVSVLEKYKKGLHAPDLLRTMFKTIRLQSEDGDIVVYQHIK